MSRTVSTTSHGRTPTGGGTPPVPATSDVNAAESLADPKSHPQVVQGIVLADHAQPAEQWAERINAQFGKSVETIIAAGRLLVEAKSALKHGEWHRMFNKKLVPFNIRSAQRLMAIAGHPLLSNTTHVSLLPPAWGTLYALTEVPEPTLKAALGDGRIYPGMGRKDVRALCPTSEGPVTPARRVRSGLQCASSALRALARIPEDDPHSAQALIIVQRWIAVRRLPLDQREPLFVEIWKELPL